MLTRIRYHPVINHHLQHFSVLEHPAAGRIVHLLCRLTSGPPTSILTVSCLEPGTGIQHRIPCYLHQPLAEVLAVQLGVTTLCLTKQAGIHQPSADKQASARCSCTTCKQLGIFCQGAALAGTLALLCTLIVTYQGQQPGPACNFCKLQLLCLSFKQSHLCV